jgi:PKD repeat protein
VKTPNQPIRAGLLLLFVAAGNGLCAASVERWDVFEVALPGPASPIPYRDVSWSATFTQGDRRVTVPGFWEDGATYKVRFSPPTTGEWRYATHSATPELNGRTGVFTATEPTPDNHGPVEVFNTFYLRYRDGTPYHQFGTTCYAWVHQPYDLQEQTLKTLAAAPFNKIRFCVFPKSYYVANTNEPERFAFLKGADGKFDFRRPDPLFWHHFEQRILDLQQLGIQADIILWHPYDRWGFSEMNPEEDDRYLRYCIARFSAFRNVWWSLANEYDFMTQVPKGHRGNKHWEDWDRFFSILQNEDPHQRLRGIHNGAKWYDHAKPWVTHASLQTSDMDAGVTFRERYHKPVIYDECRYEGNISPSWGNLTAREMTQRFWLGTSSGCYVGHGETYLHPQDILWWSKGGLLHGQSPPRIQWLKDFMARAPAFHELKPLGDGKGSFVLAKEGSYYLMYCVDQRSQTLRLAGTRPYKVDVIDPWEMTVTPVGTASPGEYTFSAPKPDLAYRFTLYEPGEKLRPEARIMASAVEGLPPLKVEFTRVGGGDARWDFGDGTVSRESTPAHVFQKPGIYLVKLAVTDADAGSAQAFQRITVDRNATEPILRVGIPEAKGATAVMLHGSAKCATDGSFQLPEGPPWGWVQVADPAREELGGLRSFTVMGWLKPASLQTGAGGNRILHCLKQDRSGIDLVCHADGRLRLAVNQWPDDVQNDSSPGKLQVGRWTCFAVTYDSTASGENVSWYFSAPTETPGSSTVTLDRKTAYHAGPVAGDVGPLVIGNFNETMHSFGLDRQFRGEIRALRMFGSRVSGKGALNADQINARLR